MKKCPLFSVCGGCRYDFTAPDYRDKKIKLIDDWETSFEPFWTDVGCRRRADFAFADGQFGFYERGTKNIVPVKHCPNLVPEINRVLTKIADLPFEGAGSALITLCENGIDLAITSNVPYFSRQFKSEAEKLGFVRVTWNGTVVYQKDTPRIKFGNNVVDYPIGTFLQPTVPSESAMRRFVVENAAGAKHIADLFCGIGNFTFALNADGFDIAGIGVQRDLFKKPLTAKMLNNYDLVVMDPPRAGAEAQSHELAKSKVPRIIYVSCNPTTLRRDSHILTRAGYNITDIAAFDQFVGSPHWELAIVFQK
ncbi:MAG: class I SAM-dependent RNA methyltransferase [Alphaproteobacteria bacterium]|nr:class I SAM-dependent RNA methyltransferase [Alphaproteobacteria bacterium]